MPTDTRSATLLTALSTGNATSAATFAIVAEAADGTSRPLLRQAVSANDSEWQSVAIPLDGLAGRQARITFATEGCTPPDCLGLYRYPTIALDLGR